MLRDVPGPARFQAIIFDLQDQGVLNINLVSPTHQAPQIFDVIREAKQSGLRIPVVYNCDGYENPDFLEMHRQVDDLEVNSRGNGNVNPDGFCTRQSRPLFVSPE